jgi:molybdenum cofactor cytidylyltransferase
VLAAGKSTRMGRQKMLMPWGDTTVLGKVVRTLQMADIAEITLVTNSDIAAQLSFEGIQILLNDNGEMLSSIQTGLQALNPSAESALICLGDQPQIEERSVKAVCDKFREGKSAIVVPSYQMRRGHPWLVAKPLWHEILGLKEGQSMRGFLNAHAAEIEYVPLDTPTILQDLDTPDDYLKYKPGM